MKVKDRSTKTWVIDKDKCKRETKEDIVTMYVIGSKNYIVDNIHEKNFRREDYLIECHIFGQWSYHCYIYQT